MAEIEPDRDDVPPSGDEAEAQSEETLMPWIWGAIGVLVIAAFVVVAIYTKPVTPPPAVPQHSIMETGAHS
jgi:hypothetical protein